MTGQKNLTQDWRRIFVRTLERPESGEPPKQAAMAEALGAWIKHLTGVVVAGCEAMGWRAAAKGYPGQVLPVSRGEYLSLDVVAFADSSARWPFPIAILSLENSPVDDLVGDASGSSLRRPPQQHGSSSRTVAMAKRASR